MFAPRARASATTTANDNIPPHTRALVAQGFNLCRINALLALVQVANLHLRSTGFQPVPMPK